MSISKTIEPTERLGRGVFSRRYANKAENSKNIPFRIFLEAWGKRNISVDRLDKPTLVEAITNAENVAKKRRAGAKFYGWAVLIVKDAAADQRQVISSPTHDNPYHADICLPESAVNSRDEQMSHAKRLADLSHWYNPNIVGPITPNSR